MKIAVYIIALLAFVSCAKKSDDLSKVDQTIYVRSNKADMPVHVHGNVASNTIILMVHGGPGGNGLEYRSGKYVEYLEQRYGMAYWDQRGQGMSQGNYNKSLVTIDQMVIDMKAVINSLKHRYGKSLRVIALGHSWGGMLTAKFMVTGNNQHLLAGWIESNGAHDLPQLNKDAIAMFVSEADTQIALGNHVSDWQGVKSWALSIDSNNISTAQSGEINSKAHEVEKWLLTDGVLQKGEEGGISNKFLTGPTNPLVSWLSGNQTNSKLNDEIEATALTQELKTVSIPTLVIWGKYDFVVPPTLGEDCYHNISSKNKRLLILDKSAHSPMDNQWEEYSKAVEDFIESI